MEVGERRSPAFPHTLTIAYDGLTDRRLFTAESFVVERIVGTDTLPLVADAISSNTDAIVETRTVEAAPGD